MIDEGEKGHDESSLKEQSRCSRWTVFGVLGVLVIIMLFLTFLYSQFETIVPFSLLAIPIVVFLVHVAYRWASGSSVSDYNSGQDERTLESMRKHALRAERAGGFEMYRCPGCQISFEIVNALPIEDDAVLCPHCGTRLLVG
jgi:predicted Zn finger-like uncharacterized protein